MHTVTFIKKKVWYSGHIPRHKRTVVCIYWSTKLLVRIVSSAEHNNQTVLGTYISRLDDILAQLDSVFIKDDYNKVLALYICMLI